jgi:hypothetical protein
MAPPTISALAMALNGQSASVDIPQPRGNKPAPLPLATRDNFTAVPASAHRGDLPTPPNSISPVLPPHRRRGSRATANTSNEGHSDLDLADVPEDAGNALSAEALDSLGDLDSVGAITPAMLAKHHLPDILLSHGPLAIRHIMSYLNMRVPGFSRITSAKARRLVVSALECRGEGVAGGLNGDVVFDKVGWGRWDARVKGAAPRQRPSSITPPGSLGSTWLEVPGPASNSDHLGTSIGNSAVFSHSDYDDHDQEDAMEEEADRMSLDGHGYASSPEPDPVDEDMGEGDVTDEEDWASIGAEALRARSLPKSPRLPSGGGRIYQPIASYSIAPSYRARSPDIARSMPARHASGIAVTIHSRLGADAGINKTTPSLNPEQDAAQALLSLGSL